LVSVEQYPDLKADQSFLKLQDELASTENQILTARTRFNEAVKPYNTHIKTFPNSYLLVFLDSKKKPISMLLKVLKNRLKLNSKNQIVEVKF
jgi:LemA protein